MSTLEEAEDGSVLSRSAGSDAQTDDVVAIGRCPEHGIVAGEEVLWLYPRPSQCECGKQLKQAQQVPVEEVDQIGN